MIRNIDPGTLWPTLQARAARALQCGAIHPLSTSFEFMEQHGVQFLVRMVSPPADTAGTTVDQPRPSLPPNEHADPFLPYDQDLFVADISETHVCLLNKYSELDHHILMVTRSFQEQESSLTLRDMETVLVCLREFDGLVFYNAGKTAGASQRHKHLQMVPLPLRADLPRVPIEPLVGTAKFDGNLGIVPGLPFLHVLAGLHPEWIVSPETGASELRQQYLQMLRTVMISGGGAGEDGLNPGPYNLLVTRQWMLLVPRTAECFHDISVNALGFAGELLAQDERQLNVLKTFGPMTALQRVAISSTPR
jgi:sulfate adenylyltransferase (ADP) / ATP adenylyltransferase